MIKKWNLYLALAFIFCVSLPLTSTAAEYPVKTIELVCPFGAGGSTSMGARIIAGTLGEILGKPVIVNNKPGAGGAIAASYVAKSKPDGYTLFVFNSGTNGVIPAVRSVDYKTSDFELFGEYATQPLVLVVKGDAPWKSVQELAAHAKKNPNALKYATSGIGTSGFFAMEIFKGAAGGLKIDHVPFKSGPEYLAALLGGHAHTGVLYGVDVKGPVEAGKLRVLAAASEKRLDDYPNVPTFAEAGYPEVKLYAWYGIAAPKGLPKDVSDKLRDALAKTFQHAEVKKMLTHIGYVPVYREAEDFRKFVAEEEKKYQKVAKEAQIKVE
jgi:tripartite-type tricarboxylate transporter receptor subunit TctC